MPLAPGTRLGAYEIVAAIGAGGMGEVYRARDAKLDRDVAVKVLPPHLNESPDALGRFEITRLIAESNRIAIATDAAADACPFDVRLEIDEG